MIAHRPTAVLGGLALLAALPLAHNLPSTEPAASPPAAVRNVGLEAARTWVDVDADGRLDLYVADPTLGDHLFVQVEPGRFEDRFALSGLDATAGSRLALWSDFDADEHPDVFRIAPDGSGRLWRNMGDGTFADVSDLVPLPAETLLTAARWIDLDGDGLPDLELVGAEGTRVLHNEGGLRFASSLLLPVSAGGVPMAMESASEEVAAESAAGEGTPTAEQSSPGSPGSPVRERREGAQRQPVRTSIVLSEIQAAASAGTPGGSTANLQLAPHCARTLRDQAGGCLSASSTPELGKLYPLSSELFVSPIRGVGVGTTSPTFSALHVKSYFADPNVRLEGTGPDGMGGTLAFGASTKNTYLSETEDDSIYMVAPTGVGIGPGNVGIHVGSLSEATHALTVKPNGSTQDILRLIGPFGSFGHGAELNFGDGNYVTLTEDTDDHLLVSTRQGTTIETDGVAAVPSLRVDQSVGSGTASPALRVDNSSTASGIALFATTSGTDANTVLTQNGTGSVLRGFVSGALKFEMRNDGRMVSRSVEITGGSDLVESFETDVEVEPGTVLVIDPTRPGQLTPSSAPYDARVAGIASGAGGVEPGLHLRQEGVMDGSVPVAMAGRVYVKCSAENGAVRPGDLLTTAELAGHAMRASDSERAFGTVIGKAMTGLDEGTGLVLVLVNLQ